MKRAENKNMMVLVIIFIVTLTSSIGYSALQSNLKVTADLKIHPQLGKSLYDLIKNQAVLDNKSSSYVVSQNGIDFGKGSTKDGKNGKGVYELHTTSNNNYPTYYYRGAVTDNNVLFAEQCWKIVRTTDTGGIKLIYNGKAVNNNCLKPSYDSKLNDTEFNIDNDYDGYTNNYDTTDSTIKTKVDRWYEENIKNKYSSYLEDSAFCNDRSISQKYSVGTTYYQSYERIIINKTPSLTCNEEDKLTVANKILKYPIGLITLDEVVYAGGAQEENIDFYLGDNNAYFWTMTPYEKDTTCVFMWCSFSDGYVNDNATDAYAVALPVLSLVHNIKYIKGTGTADNPYVIN